MNQTPWYFSWPVIIIAIIACWPIGLALLFFRSRAGGGDSQSMLIGSTNKMRYYIVGAVLVVLGIVWIGNKNVGMGIFTILGGIAIVFFSGFLTKRAERNKKYLDLITNRNVKSIDKIAAAVGLSYKQALSEIQQMEAIGLLKGISIDENRHLIVYEQIAGNGGAMGNMLGGGPAVERVEVVCPGCGSRVAIPRGAQVKCEYCRMPIIAK